MTPMTAKGSGAVTDTNEAARREYLYRWRARNPERVRQINRESWGRASAERRQRRLTRERVWRKDNRDRYLTRRRRYARRPEVREHCAIYKKWRVWWVPRADRTRLAIDRILRDLAGEKITEGQAHVRMGHAYSGATHMAYQ